MASPEANKRRLGLDAESSREMGASALLTGAATDPKTGFVAALSSKTDFDAADNPKKVVIDYLRHVPYGTSHRQNLITFKADDSGPEKITIQAFTVFDRARGDSMDDPIMHRRVNRVIGAVNVVNNMLRNREPVEDLAKVLLKDLKLDEVTGEAIIMRGLSSEGGFAPLYLPGIFAKAANAEGATAKAPLEFRNVGFDDIKTIVGFPINTLEPHNNHATNRAASRPDPATGIGFVAGVRVNETPRKLDVEMYIEPEDVPAGLDPKAIPNLIKFSFKQKNKDTVELTDAQFLGQQVAPSDTAKVLSMIGIAQVSNKSLARRKYPAFMDSAAEFDLLDLVDPLTPPPPLSKGGEMLHVSLHGSGVEKRIENIGDQIGIAAVFLHRGTRKDGSVSTVGVAVDFPFASGGPNSGFDGAVPDYLPFLKHIDHFFITHDHFDHNGGLPYYVRKGLMKGKTIHAEERVIYMIQQALAEVPRDKWPEFEAVKGEGATPIRDTDGNVRFWVQHYANATVHSAMCTPYHVSGCVNDDHYNGTVTVYGDSRGLKKEAESFFQEGPRKLPQQAAAHGLTVTPSKVNRDISVVLHDVTSVRDKGHSTPVAEVEANTAQVINNLFAGKGIVFTPISTNHLEYTSALRIASMGDAPRNITAVGRNAELRLTSLNLFGVNPDMNLKEVRLDPYQEGAKGNQSLIPAAVLDSYAKFLQEQKALFEELELSPAEQKEWDEDDRKKYDRAYNKFYHKHIEEYREGLAQGVPARSTQTYMLESLIKNGAVTFDNDVNGYLMYKAIEAHKDWAPARATRTSETAKSFRENPGSHLIFTTGTQGNAEERFATLQKFIDGFSLLDTDERVRPTGYRIEPKDYVIVIPQSPIPGNEDSQRLMIEKLVASRDVTVVAAFKDGFTIYNPKDMRDDLNQKMREMGWNHDTDAGGNIAVHGRPIHMNGHGREQDVAKVAQMVKADIHTAHHIPDADSIVMFNDLMDRLKLNRSQEKPDDFKVMRIDAKKQGQDKFKLAAHLNPSYILVRMVRKYGQFFGGFLEWTRATLLKREGLHRDDGMHAAGASDGKFKKLTAQKPWAHLTNPHVWKEDAGYQRRTEKLGPANDQRRQQSHPRSKPLFNAHVPRPGKIS